MQALDKHSRPLATLDYNALLAYSKVVENEPNQTLKDVADARGMQELFALHQAGAVRLIVPVSAALEAHGPTEFMSQDRIVARLCAVGMEATDIFVRPLSVGFGTPDTPNQVTFDHTLEARLHQAIHAILFEGKTEPDARNIDFGWVAYRGRVCARRGIVSIEEQALVELDSFRLLGNISPSPLHPNGRQTPALNALTPARRDELEVIRKQLWKDWMNKKCDAEGLYIHVSHALNTSQPQHCVFVTSDKNFTRNRPKLKQTNFERLKALGFPGHIMEPDKAVAHFIGLMNTG